MVILVVDGQGGNIGSQIIKAIKEKYQNEKVIAVGTNAIASATMLKAGAEYAATGENPLIVACRKADVIIGPIGIVIADSMHGEITPKMAVAIAQSDTSRILIPVNKCENQIAGVADLSIGALISDMIDKLGKIIG
ncbi:MAG: DUF3842 family protein [Sphaerochaetaceae bacterium]|nr:DUF3842 family protein [Sphaerochaetaceae bacterium]